MTEQPKTPLYEVGTFEQYEAGFHAFYRTLNKDKALKVLEKAKDCHARLPEYDLQKVALDGFEHDTLAEYEKIDSEFQQAIGKKFNISMYQGDLYTIELREVTLDD